MKYLLIVMLTIIPLGLNAQWKTFSNEDEMTGEKSIYASSPTSNPTKNIGQPYSDLTATLVVSCDKEKEWTYVIFNKDANLNYDVTRDNHQTAYSRIKWDEEIKEVIFTKYDNHKALHLYDDKTVISDIEKYGSALVELNWYSEGRIFFRFNLSGSSAALQKIRNQCSSL